MSLEAHSSMVVEDNNEQRELPEAQDVSEVSNGRQGSAAVGAFAFDVAPAVATLLGCQNEGVVPSYIKEKLTAQLASARNEINKSKDEFSDNDNDSGNGSRSCEGRHQSRILDILSEALLHSDETLRLLAPTVGPVLVELIPRAYTAMVQTLYTGEETAESAAPRETFQRPRSPASVLPMKRALDMGDERRGSTTSIASNDENSSNIPALEATNATKLNEMKINMLVAICNMLPLCPSAAHYLDMVYGPTRAGMSVLLLSVKREDHYRLLRALRRALRYTPKVIRPLLDADTIIAMAKAGLANGSSGDDYDRIVSYYCCSIVGLVMNMNHEERAKLFEQYIPHVDDSAVKTIRELEYLEFIDNIDDTQMTRQIFDVSSEHGQEEIIKGVDTIVTANDLSNNTIDLAGYLFPASNGSQMIDIHPTKSIRAKGEGNKSFIHTDKFVESLNSVAQAMALDLPVMIQGPSGCGKHALFEETVKLYGITGTVYRINLDQSTDSKTLLGTYVCSSTPGKFKWQDGILTIAVKTGAWVLISNVDQAPLDVLAILTPLIESRTLLIPQQGERINALPGFRIFATRVTNSNGDVRELTAGESVWQPVSVKLSTDEDLCEIVAGRFPMLKKIGIVNRLVLAYKEVKSMLENSLAEETASTMRLLNMRDLFKFVSRCNTLIENNGNNILANVDDITSYDSIPAELQEDIFRDGCDCFTTMLSNPDFRTKVDMVLGEILGIAQHRIVFYSESYSPSCVLDQRHLSVGRCTMPIESKTTTSLFESEEEGRIESILKSFAMTHNSQRLLESLVVSVEQNEPVLLVGETGTGKTTTVSFLADAIGRKLVSINLSQQSESSDLLGGFKPVDVAVEAVNLNKVFENIFISTFGMKRNKDFLSLYLKSFKSKRWTQCIKAWKYAIKMSKDIIRKYKDALKKASMDNKADSNEVAQKLKKRLDDQLIESWSLFEKNILRFESMIQNPGKAFFFSFMEGSLVSAIKEGHWVLLDEINLASAETLECLVELLQSPHGSLTLIESGDYRPIRRHKNFRLFACMNPANDSGKKNLPDNIRFRFTERWVDSPDKFERDLHAIVRKYLQGYLPPGNAGEALVSNIGTLYVRIKSASDAFKLLDGADQRYRVSVRTLTRALIYAKSICGTYGIQRSIYEGMCMSFATGLNTASLAQVESWIAEFVGKGFNPRHIPQDPSSTNDSGDTFDGSRTGSEYSLIGPYWLKLGPETIPENIDSTFVVTETVSKNLYSLSRAVMTCRYPVLIQGPTSAGKTSIVEFLAKKTGHRFVRINNHEHTDLQEYVGSWMSTENGQLVFQHGVLVDALKNGYWIVLDELNLAPSDVLEALNRLLDDNRELLIPETQEIIKPHKDFMLFATQNPAGLYGGRKQLSNAFRNRFLELHFGDIPQNELLTILSSRCAIAPSYASKVVEVFRSLQTRRGNSRVFEGKQSFATLRDLFRWANRECVGYEQLAWEGWCLIGEKMRSAEERKLVKEILEQTMRVTLDIDKSMEKEFLEITTSVKLDAEGQELYNSVVWTASSRRLLVLVAKCLKYDEPVLLVGDTGAGKTTVCQVLAALYMKKMHILNVHQNSEVSDFIGSQRPLRGREAIEEEFTKIIKEIGDKNSLELVDDIDIDYETVSTFIGTISAEIIEGDAVLKETIGRLKFLRMRLGSLFSWVDGPLTQAMKLGQYFLIDEISLADDSVLERLNSVLEPSHLLVLAEKGGENVEELIGHKEFRVLATMNPGGDYGKKELSPALRNRFTEIWVSSITDRIDLSQILSRKIKQNETVKDSAAVSESILDFIEWFKERINKQKEICFGMRDLLSWIGFINYCGPAIGAGQAFINGGVMVAVDGIGVNPAFGVQFDSNGDEIFVLRKESIHKLYQLANRFDQSIVVEKDNGSSGLGLLAGKTLVLSDDMKTFGIGPFQVELGSIVTKSSPFALDAPTTQSNAIRVLRAMQFKKPILLEGSPGVGKTSLINALATNCKFELVRINLSEQTDLMDLFGSDLPVEGTGNAGKFAWRNGPFLHAMLEGHWVLLDELNLASQTVLEGLNACLDHRGEVYIPELDRTFRKSPNFRVFAAQNPQSQGGGRKGLPKSFVNRFTTVFVDALSAEDLKVINKMHLKRIKTITEAELQDIIKFNEAIARACDNGSLGYQGGPWEFNLRDVSRFIELLELHRSTGFNDISSCIHSLYVQRFRTQRDRDLVETIARENIPSYSTPDFTFEVVQNAIRVGSSKIDRPFTERAINNDDMLSGDYQILKSQIPTLESLLNGVQLNTLSILVGPSGTGKTTLVRLLAFLCGVTLSEFSLNPGIDSMELLGGFEQVSVQRKYEQLSRSMDSLGKDIQRLLIVDGVTIAEFTMAMNTLNSKFTSSQNNKERLNFEQLNQIYSTLCKTAVSIGADERFAKAIKLCETNLAAYDEVLRVSVTGNFEWTDSVLLKAITNGDWLLLDNVNVCPSSVLDRLNGLLEPNGVLTLNERGLVGDEIITLKPHKNFRIFMAMDPRHGEISRAMRNRSVEIYIPSLELVSEHKDLEGALIQSPTRDLETILLSKGVPNKDTIDFMINQVVKQKNLDLNKMSSFNVILEMIRRHRGLDEIPKGFTDLEPRSTPFFVGVKDLFFNSIPSHLQLWGQLMVHHFAELQQGANVKSENTLPVILDVWKTLPTAVTIEDAKLWVEFANRHLNVRDDIMEGILGWLNIYSTIEPSKLNVAWKNYLLGTRINSQMKTINGMAIGECNPLQQAYLVSRELADRDEMRFSGTVKIWKLLTKFNEFISNFVQASTMKEMDILTAALDDILSYIENLTMSMTSYTCMFEEIVFSMKKIKLSWEAATSNKMQINEEIENISQHLEETLEDMDWDYITSTNNLWSKGGIVILRDERLLNLDTLYKKINQKLEVSALVYFADKDLRWKILEALATIYIVDVNTKNNANAHLDKLLETISLVGKTTLENLQSTLDPSASIEQKALKITAYFGNHSAMIQYRDLLVKYSCITKDTVLDLEEIPRFIQFCLSSTTILPSDLAPMQRLYWKLKNSDSPAGEEKDVIRDAFTGWHNVLWRTPTKFLHESKGKRGADDMEEQKNIPLIDALWYGFNSEGFLREFRTLEQYPLSDIPVAENAAGHVVDFVKSDNYIVSDGIISNAILLTARLSDFIVRLTGDDESFVVEELTRLRQHYKDHGLPTKFEINVSIKDYVLTKCFPDSKTNSHHEFEAESLLGVFGVLNQIVSTNNFEDNHYLCGMGWLLFSSCSILCHVPPVPYDPAVEPFIAKQIGLKDVKNIEIEVDTREKLDDIYISQSQRETIDLLKKRDEELKLEISALEEKIAVRPSETQIEDIFHDLRELKGMYFDPEIMTRLIAEIDTSFKNKNAKNNNYSGMVENITTSLDVALSRMTEKYPLYRDLLHHIILSIQEYRYSVTLCSQAIKLGTIKRSSGPVLVKRSLSFCEIDDKKLPSTAVLRDAFVNQQQEEGKFESGALYVDYLIGFLENVALHMDFKSANMEDLSTLNEYFNDLFEIWESQERHRIEKINEENETFKIKTKEHTFETIEEQDLAYMAQLFPSYEDEFADIKTRTMNDEDEPVVPKQEDLDIDSFNNALTDQISRKIVGLYKKILMKFEFAEVDVSTITSSTEGPAMQSKFLNAKLSLVRSAKAFVNKYDSAIDLETDMIARPSFLVLAQYQKQILKLDGDELAGNVDYYDFYRDPNPSEVKRCLPVINGLLNKINSILEEYPEQETLNQLKTICERLLAFKSASPVMKFLAGIELILGKTPDWENYASSKVSLAEHTKAISDLILKWRKLELECWRNLLQVENIKREEKTSSLWFHLWSIFLGKLEDDSLHSNVLEQVMDFVRSSSVGQYHARLGMLKSFAKHLALLSVHSPKEYSKRAYIAENVCSYFATFDDFILTRMKELRKPIEKELKGYVKIATWKDANVFAIQESARRTHYQLHKFVKKYGEVLDEPMMPLIDAFLQRVNPAGPIKKSVSFKTFGRQLDLVKTTLPIEDSNVVSYQGKMYRYTEIIFTEDSTSFIKEELNDLCIEILATITDFKQLNSKISGDKAAVKNQKNIRKKSLVTFMKKLSSLGLTAVAMARFGRVVTPDNLYMKHINDVDEFLSRFYKENNKKADIVDRWNKNNNYYWRSISRYEFMRGAANKLNEDISSLELSKMLSYTGDLINRIGEQRSWIASTCKVFDGLSIIEQQLKLISIKNVNAVVSISTELVNEIAELIVDLEVALSQALLIAKYIGQGADMIIKIAVKKTITAKSIISKYLYQDSVVNSVGISYVTLEQCDIDELAETTRDALVILTNGLNGDEIKPFYIDILNRVEQFKIRFESLINEIPSPLKFVKTEVVTDAMETIEENKPIDDGSKEVTDIILLAFQRIKTCMDTITLLKQANMDDVVNEDENMQTEIPNGGKLIADSHQCVKEFLYNAHLTKLILKGLELLDEIHEKQQTAQGNEAEIKKLQKKIDNVYVLFSQLMFAVREIYSDLFFINGVVSKFTYITANTFLSVIQIGYNLPQESPDQEGDEDSGEQSNGMGIGEGQGNKDVSDQIEDESQIEGLKGEEQQDEAEGPEPPKNKEEDMAIDTEMDFEGALEDVDADDDDEDDDNTPSDDEDQKEEMGDLDGEGDVLDEKMWDESDEEDDEGKKNEDDGKIEKDSSMNNTKEEDLEMAAAQEDEEESGDNDKSDDKKNEESGAPEEQEENGKNKEEEKEGDDNKEDNDDTPDKENNLDDAYEENHDVDVREEPKNEEPDATEELAEEENQEEDQDAEGEGEGEKEQEAQEADAAENMDDGKVEEANAEDAQDAEEEGEDESELPEDTEIKDDDEDPGEEPAPNSMAEIDETQSPEEEEEGENAKEEEEEEEEEQDTTAVKDRNKEAINEEVGVEGTDGDAAREEEDAENEVGDGTDEVENNEMMGGQERSDNGGQNDKSSQSEAQQDVNPLRSLGESIKKWTDRLKNISEVPEESEEEKKPNQDKSNEDEKLDTEADYEFVGENDDNDDFHEALADATAEQSGDVDMDMQMSDDEQEEENNGPDGMPKEEEEERDEEQDPTKKNAPKPRTKEEEEQPKGVPELLEQAEEEEKANEPTLKEQIENTEGGELESDTEREGDSLMKPEIEEEDESTEMEVEEKREVKDYDTMKRELDLMLAQYRGGDHDKISRELWENFVAMTSDEAFSLCEQLRLILEPTLSTKLKGDYRSGKRLNMRKIIPYVASQFKKDKIWLRRKRPSKRTYQIMMVVDDSKSMAESQSVKLAFESLATITTAINQLEAGQCSVVSFGEDVKLLHPFELPFDHASGANVLRSFSFNQDRTDVGLMVDTCVDILDHSRTSLANGPAELWQLQIIISDGICEDHAKLRSMVRKAAEKRIMMVFIVLDNNKESESIVKMTNVTYGVDAAGKPKVNINRYMDSFPFDYYTVVRDISTLPSVLSDTLRQFFMQCA